MARRDTFWTNWIREQRAEATRFAPRSWRELRDRMQAEPHAKLRAVGAGHSTSAVALPETGGLYVDLRALDGLPEYDARWLAVPKESVERVAAGTQVSRVIASLVASGRSMTTLGSYDGQTIAGLVATASHGSGLSHRTIADTVAAVELVTGETPPRLVRIERTQGITDPKRYASAEMALVQDDAAFFSAVVGLGCFGVVVAVTMHVEPEFWLREHQRVHAWRHLRERLPALVEKHREHFDVLVLPHAMPRSSRPFDGEVLCLVTWRERCEKGKRARPRNDAGAGAINAVARYFGSSVIEVADLTGPDIYKDLVRTGFLRRAKASKEAPFASRSDLVCKTSIGYDVQATSCEVAVPLARAVDAIDRLVELTANCETPDDTTDLDWLHTSPLGVRFVSGSDHYLAHTHGPGEAFCTIETPLVLGLDRFPILNPARRQAYRRHMLAEVERTLVGLGGRPHWGQRSFLMTPAAAEAMWPKLPAWRAELAKLGGAARFSGEVTRTLGV